MSKLLPKLSKSLLACAFVGCFSGAVVAEGVSDDDIEHIVVTASLTEHNEFTAPASVSIITAEELAKIGATNIGEAIRSTTGINFQPTTGYGRGQISIRGMDSSYTLVLINGRRVNSHDALIRGNNFDLSTIPMTAVQRIEVVRGPMSSLYGADALGGVVNVILKKPGAETTGEISYLREQITTGEGGDLNRGNAYLSGKLSETVGATVIVEALSQDDWQTDDMPEVDAIEERDALNALATLSWQLSHQQMLTFEAIYSEDERTAHWAARGSVVETNQDTDRLNLSVTHEGSWDAFDTQLRAYREEVDLTDSSDLYDTGDITQTNLTLDGWVATDLAEHSIVVGAEYRDSELDNPRDLINGDISQDQYAVFIQDEVEYGDLSLTLGGRYDDHEVFGGEFSPRAYAVYSLTHEWVVKAGVGEGFKAPGMLELSEDYQLISCGGRCWLRGNADLDAESSTTYEFGVAYQSSVAAFNITAFHNDIEDKIERDQTTAVDMIDGVPVITYQNIDEATVKGVELSAWYQLIDNLDIDANATYTDAEDDETGDTLESTPEHNVNITLNWQVSDPLYTFVRYTYIGEQVIAANNVSGYSLWNAGAGYTINETFEVRGGINNIGDKELDEDVVEYGYVEKGRSVFVNVAARF